MNPSLSKVGIPNELQNTTINDFTEDIKLKLLKAYEILDTTKVLYITGPSSIEKDKFIIMLLKYFNYKDKKKSISYIPIPIPFTRYDTTDIYTILNTCVATKYGIDTLKEFLYNNINKGSIFLIECSSFELFQELYGEDIVYYASPISAIIDLPYKSFDIRSY